MTTPSEFYTTCKLHTTQMKRKLQANTLFEHSSDMVGTIDNVNGGLQISKHVRNG